MEPRVCHESPAAFFKELVETALRRQQVRTGEHTAFYVVNLLTTAVAVDPEWRAAFEDEPLALLLGRAMESGGARRRRGLRVVGDVALFVSGFFPDRLQRRPVDVDYYATLGGYAYQSLSRAESEASAMVFAELAAGFSVFVDVLNEVSERCGMTTDSDALRLYERWLRTGSRRAGRRLIERGIVPHASASGRFLQ